LSIVDFKGPTNHKPCSLEFATQPQIQGCRPSMYLITTKTWQSKMNIIDHRIIVLKSHSHFEISKDGSCEGVFYRDVRNSSNRLFICQLSFPKRLLEDSCPPGA
jgi:hypothetical protein